jgi:signal transduction histidine kinase
MTMAATNPAPAPIFSLQKQAGDPSKQPLEIYHLSHDLRGPLNSILGFTELLLEGVEGPLNEVQHEDIAAIRQSALNLLQLINTVVDLSKVESNKLTLNIGPVQLHDLVARVLKAQAVAGRAGQVTARIPEALPPVWGDPDRIEQMILNLVTFALKAPNPGPIEITVSHDDQAAIVQVRAAALELPVEQLVELFELNVNVDAGGRSELGKGGLTLPLVQALAEKQQGQAWVESQADLGTVFYLKLPLRQSQQ